MEKQANLRETEISGIIQNPDEIERRYLAENAFLKSLSLGDYEKTILDLEYFLSFKIEPRTRDKLRHSRHMMLVLNTLCRKYLELSNHIHPLYLDDISTKIGKRLQELDNVQKINAFYKEIVRKYCLLVQNHSGYGYGSIIRNVVAYIDFHYFEDISLHILADKFNISRSYLCALFKKEVGITLTDYLHKVRIRNAIFLLNSSNLSMDAIAVACGYTDLNYFIRIFKRQNGISPKAYQKRVRRSETVL